MSRVLFCCPSCTFRKEIPRTEVPPTARQCKCPGCGKLIAVAEAIKPLESGDKSRSNIQDETAKSATAKATKKYNELLDEALSSLREENDLGAMLLLEEAEQISSTPKVRSYLAYCRAKVKNEYSDAITACRQALKEEPLNGDHYLNLGRIYLLVNKRGPALDIFRKGIKIGPHPQLMQELRKFEMRKPPVISSLPRTHAINRALGKLLYRLKLR